MVFEEHEKVISKTIPNQSFGGNSYYLSTTGDLLSSNSELNASFQQHERCGKSLLSGLLADRPRSGPPLSSNFSINENQISGTISLELFDKLQNSSEKIEAADDYIDSDDFKIPSEVKLEESSEKQAVDEEGDAISLDSPPKPSWLDTVKAYAESIHPVDCVVAMEECRPLSGKTSFMAALKNSYLHPLLQQLNGGPETNVEFGCDIYTSLYSLVTFNRSTSEVVYHNVPSSADGLPGSPLIYRIYKKLDELQHEPLFSQQESVSSIPVLESILDRFKAFDNYRGEGVLSERYLIIVTVSDFSNLEALKISKLSEEYRSRRINSSLFSPRSSNSFEQLMEIINLQSSVTLTGPPVWPTSLITGDVFASTCHFIQRESITLDSSNEYSNDCQDVPVSTPGSYPPSSLKDVVGGYDNALRRSGSAPDTGVLPIMPGGQHPPSNSNSVQEQAPSSVVSDNVHTPQSFIAASPSIITQPNTPHTTETQQHLIQQQLMTTNEPISALSQMSSNTSNSAPPPARTPLMKSSTFHSTTPSPTPAQTQPYPPNYPVQRPIAPANTTVMQRRPQLFNSPTPMHQGPPSAAMMQSGVQMMESQPEFPLFEGHLHTKHFPGNTFPLQIYSTQEITRLNDWNGQALLNLSISKSQQLVSNVASNSIPVNFRMAPATRNVLMQIIDPNNVMVMMPLSFNPSVPFSNVNFICVYKSSTTINGFIPRDQVYFFNELKRLRNQQQSHSMPQSNFSSMPPQHSQMVQQPMPPQYSQYSQRSIPMTAQQVYSSIPTGSVPSMSNMHHPNYMATPQNTTPEHMMSYNKGQPPQRMMQAQPTARMRHHETTGHHPSQMPYQQHQHPMGYQMTSVNSQMPNPGVMPQGSAMDIDYPVKFDNKTGMPYS